ncbi:ABC transporter transmembrane region [Beutenbergia cavernae DSM 12333]|uniref:ABC transporter transmembrane region n=1 Tax=Beutenbergia cavernae (strain ATCC BAA-8 / DSM 12333 / CCUG 43141 / JCM 11478 / NBRC 16432 / NCIMB 13614 / HKI 0122) TaxID=471853 RepID=C5BZV5_BEUC1|nr:ABC transporter ATP-binding protein [Beutenbergia cavernae]ACQ81285.1 ABC transporter transmembrane region [Beutenbergia cavernae DSM 12333]
MLDFARPYSDPPPLTGPGAFIRWQARHQWGLVLGGALCGVVGAVAQAAGPFVLGNTIDDGLTHGLSEPLFRWCLILLAVGIVQVGANVIGHRIDVVNWLRASLGASRLIGHHVTRTGESIRRELPTGEVVATVASDALRLGEVFAFAGRAIGGGVAYIVVAFVLLDSSTTLGLSVLIGLPVVAGLLALLVRPLQRRQAAQREANGRLTTLGSDTVSGLRILRGIGGEDVFTGRYRVQSQKVRHAGVAVAQTQSILDGLQALLPGLFLAGVVWYGARLAIAGEITPGQLVTFYGYAAFLTEPLRSATQAVQILTRARIAAGKIVKVLAVTSAVSDRAKPEAMPEPGSVLVDEASGLVVRRGELVALVDVDPDSSAAIATRLGRFDDDAERATPVRLGGTLLADLRVEDIRNRIVVAEATPTLFTGTLADEIDARSHASREEMLEAMRIADAADVLDSVPDGLDGEIAEKGRSLSGGQRQRVALARALLTEAEVLVLIEPTSAVDAHTEARIATRLAEARRGRTTVVVTASPLVLDQCDDVAFVEDGRVRTRGTHRELISAGESAARGEPTELGIDPDAAIAYRRVVSRAVADSPAETPGTLTEDTHDATEPEGATR